MLNQGDGQSGISRQPSMTIFMIIAPTDQPTLSFTPFQRGALKGESAVGLQTFPFTDAPWEIEMGKRDGDFEMVKTSTTRRVLKCLWTLERDRAGALRSVEIYAKRYKVRNVRKALIQTVYSPKAVREFRLMNEMLKRGIPCPQPLLWAVYRQSGLPAFSYLITRSLGDEFVSFEDLMNTLIEESERLSALRALAHFLRAAQNDGFYHDDCSANHIMVNSRVWRAKGGGREVIDLKGKVFTFIDVDNAKLSARPIAHKLCVRNAFQIMRSMKQSEREQETFIKACFGDLGDAELKELNLEINRISQKKTGKSIVK